jgi:predicted enzyme related to lactoylglutathione lyase
MPDRRNDPFDALHDPVSPRTPDPAFAAALRERLLRAVAASSAKENVMRNEMTARPRNGIRHGDVSYITLGLPDLARGRDFYAAVLGWRYGQSRSDHGAQPDVIIPMIGLWDGEQQVGGRVHGAVLGFRVDDIASAVESVRSHGGTISDPHPEPYALAAEGHDDQGTPFYLHQMPPEDAAPEVGATFHNGEVEGDVSYLTMVVPDVDAARAFYGGVFGWAFNVGRAGGAQVSGVAPQIGMTTQPEAGPATPGVILCYRVDDIAAAIERVRHAGGQASEVAQRPYGLESLCADDQGTPFYLHQF